jgi:HD-like signal output (HDOD) protein
MPEPSVKRISEIIARDMGMTAKVLQMINSGLFGLRNRVDSVAQAVALLGLETIQSLVLTIHVFSKFNPSLLHALGIEGIWSHSQAVSELARRIAVLQVSKNELADRKLPEQAGIAGLLHDVGKLIIAKALPFDFKKLQMMRETTRVPLWQVERAQLGTTHEEVGAYLLGLWGLPDVIVEAVAWHHRPGETQYCTLSPLAAVHVANALLHQKQTACPPGSVEYLDAAFLERAGLIGHLSAWEALRDDVVRELAGSRY